MTTQNVKTGTIEQSRKLPEILVSLRRRILRRVWYVHPGLTLTVNTPPAICLRILGTISRPDARRLEYRHLFASGRRYHLHQTQTGFAVTTTSKVFWNYRQRTSPNAVLFGDFEEVDKVTTRILLRGRIKISHLLSSFLIPTFVSSMVLSMPWHTSVLISLVTLLFGLSWAGHRLNAALEVYEMIHFVTKALEAHIPEPALAMSPGGVIAGVSRERDFMDAWEKFYESHRNDAHESGM
jgi:hypothetical protein